MSIVLEMPCVVDPDTCALVFSPFDTSPDAEDYQRLDHTDPEAQHCLTVYDEAGNQETALQYAQDGYIVVAVNPVFWYDGTVRHTTQQLQQIFDMEQDLYADCFQKPERFFPRLVPA
jgi:hypothetical protein